MGIRLAMSEKLCLKWNDFQENVSSAFGSLREDNEFSDVTLACEDGQQEEAHKVILVASSPFFQSLLRRNKHPHHLIYMRGVKSEDLVAIVDFLYFGEANVYQEKIESFLAIAEELNLKGLTVSESDDEMAEEKVQQEPFIDNKTNFTKQKRQPSYEEAKVKYEGAVAVRNLEASANFEELDEQINSMMTKGQTMIPDGPSKSIKATVCNLCGKEGKRNDVRRHIESIHLEGVSVPCSSCDKTFRTRRALKDRVCQN